jgi:hypothetical protein
MAVTVKKMNATVKPHRIVSKRGNGIDMAKAAGPSREEIKQLAVRFWADRGYEEGYAEQDWLQAERELLQRAY